MEIIIAFLALASNPLITLDLLKEYRAVVGDVAAAQLWQNIKSGVGGSKAALTLATRALLEYQDRVETGLALLATEEVLVPATEQEKEAMLSLLKGENKKALVAECKAQGIPYSGTKAVLVTRIMENVV